MSNPDLRRCHSILTEKGFTRGREKNINDVRTIANECVVNKDGLIVKKRLFPYQPPTSELIVIPRDFVPTVVSELYGMWNTLSLDQMMSKFKCEFFTPNINEVLKSAWQSYWKTPRGRHVSRPRQEHTGEMDDYASPAKPQSVGIHTSGYRYQAIESGCQVYVKGDES